MEKLYPSNKVRFRHLYDKTDKEEQILFYRCSLMVETYIKIHVRNQEDVYNLRQEVLLKVVEGLDKSYHERGRFFQWAMTITINMVNDYYRRKKNAPTMVALDNEAVVAHTAGYSSLKNRHKAQRKAKFYINKCRSASCMQGGLKQASA